MAEPRIAGPHAGGAAQTLFEIESTTPNGLLAPSEIVEQLAAGSPVAIGVSGGKDSCAVAIAVNEYLDSVGHLGERILIHSDLGRVEWKDSLPTCERLASYLGLELVVVRRKAGGMLERWQQRWAANVQRYHDLSCVQLILPWSTPAMRFCTSELKTDVICSSLRARFVGQTILSVSGIRRDESAKRAKVPALQAQPKLSTPTRGTCGFDWHPLLPWTKCDVFTFLAERGFRMHEAYAVYGSSRVSCGFCMMACESDLVASSTCPDNQDLYREMVALEIESAFSFQGNRWLGDVAPHLLDAAALRGLERAKDTAHLRAEFEGAIPKHLLYTAGWPHRVPTREEAELLADVRRQVAALYGWAINYADADGVIARHVELLSLKAEREQRVGRRRRKAA
jgi:3'-phosphoadenosine 5'-phosphosulfate sulfotransferase (PAPS reductase)/FAD synthetase